MASDPKQPDLDSILDAALDELDHDSDNDEPAAPLSPAATTLYSEKAAAVSAPAAPASDKHDKPTYGPQRPPTNLTPQEAELASSLENMMEQFMSFGNIENDEATLQNAERAMEEMFLKMMQQDSSNSGDVVGDSTQSNVAVSTAAAAARGGSVKKKDKSNKVQDNTKSRGKKSSVKSSEKKQSKETNMDETINTLLNNIQQPESTPIAPNMEEFADASISNLLNDISAMTNANDANPLIDTVMKQLLDKELMYQPMKEVCNRFPAWLAKNKETLSHEEYERYGKQYQYFQKIVHVYEVEPGNFERLMELMQDIQEYGQPPVEIIKELAPELQFDDEGMPIMDPMGNGGPMMPPFMPGMPFPGGDGEQCCVS